MHRSAYEVVPSRDFPLKIGYLLLCQASPGILVGLTKISGDGWQDNPTGAGISYSKSFFGRRAAAPFARRFNGGGRGERHFGRKKHS